MDLLDFWPLTALLACCLIYASLYLAAVICRVPEISAGKLATASLVMTVVLGAFDGYAMYYARDMGEGGIIVIPIALAANFIIMLLVAPWLLRPPREYGSGSAWGAAALGGLFFCILLVAVPAGVSTMSSKLHYSKVQDERTRMLASYNLPVPEGADFMGYDKENVGVTPYMGPPGAKRPPPSWFNRYSATHAAMYTVRESPNVLVDFTCSGLTQGGYEVYRLPHQMIAGSKPGVFVLYFINPDMSLPEYAEAQNYGVQMNFTSCNVKIYESHAEEMTALCREASAGG